jgi:beta-lactamase superfamily II metal-dependent hydrolase
MTAKIKVFPAANGDSFLISVKNRNFIIDGGKGELCHNMLVNEIKQIEKSNQIIDLLIVTHIDDDHIAGIIKLYNEKDIDSSIFKKVWFNSGSLISYKLSEEEKKDREIPLNPLSREMSVTQGLTLEKRLHMSDAWEKELICAGYTYNLGEGMTITTLSPDLDTLIELNNKWEVEKERIEEKLKRKRMMSTTNDYDKKVNELFDEDFVEDKSLFNKSSIAFLLEYEGYRVLMLGDSHPSIVVKSLTRLGFSEENKLKVNVMKISHHGSRHNTSNELLRMIECTRFIISSDGSKHGLPNKRSLARIIKIMDEPVTFYFNYDSMNKIFSPEEIEENNITCVYLSDSDDYTVGD